MIVFECDLYYLSIGLSIYIFPWLTWQNHTMEIFGTTKKIMLWKVTLWKFMLWKGLLYLPKNKQNHILMRCFNFVKKLNVQTCWICPNNCNKKRNSNSRNRERINFGSLPIPTFDQFLCPTSQNVGAGKLQMEGSAYPVHLKMTQKHSLPLEKPNSMYGGGGLQ